MEKLLTKNKTLGLYTFNLPARLTCPGKSSWCSKYCYAGKGNFLYQNVKIGQANRLKLTEDLPVFIETMVNEIHSRKITVIRVHSSGDFYSIDYFHAWLEIAQRCPTVAFYAYTRTWRVPLFDIVLNEAEHIDNFTLWRSTDISTSTPINSPRIAYILPRSGEVYHPTMPKVNCAKQLDQDHAVNCVTCGMCFDKKTQAVTFMQH